MRIVVISLERSQDRRKKVAEQLDKLALPWSFIDATDGSKILYPVKEYNPILAERLLGYRLTNSEIGCFLSHREAWKKVLECNEAILVLEDDFIIGKSFMDAFIFANSQKELWEVCRFQGLTDQPYKVVKSSEIKEINLVKILKDPLGSAAYIASPVGAKKLLKHSEQIVAALDHYLENTIKHKVNLLAIYPYPITTTNEPSTITDRPDRKPIKGTKKFLRSFWRKIYWIKTGYKKP